MIKHILAGTAAIAAGTLIGLNQAPTEYHRDELLIREHPHRTNVREEIESMASKASSKYKISHEFATKVAELAKKHEHPVFPKAKDIMSIVGIESSFNPNAKSKLKVAPARGLTQIRPEIWGMKHSELATPEQQIAKGSEILASYHQKFNGDADLATHAYNIGLTNMKRGTGLNPKYVVKFKKERELYD